MNDGFFDRVIGNALDRGVAQFVLVGAGHDGRARRHTRAGIRWWLAGVPARPGEPEDDDAGIRVIQHDQARGGLGALLTASGFEPDARALFCCDVPASRLSPQALGTLVTELRSLATPGTRLALAIPADGGHAEDGPADQAETDGLFGRGRWRAVEISERARRAGFRMLAPLWAPAASGVPPSAGRIAAFAERMLYRSGGDAVAGHLEAAYGVTVTRTRELDLGVHRADLAGPGQASWIARVFPAVRDVGAVSGDAALLRWLAAAGFPAERCASSEPVSVLDGQAVLVTELAPGRALPGKPATFERLGRLLGQLHSMPVDGNPAASRPGGAWHHLLPDGSTADEIAAARTLLHDARHRVRADAADGYDALLAAAEAGDACTDLPHCLVHPDCVPRNAIGHLEGDATLIDWTGAGWGPRIVSLGCLLWAAGGRTNVAAVISGYRRFVTLEPGEVDRLGGATRLRPLVLACWTFAAGRDQRSDGGWWDQQRRRADAAAAHARTELRQPAPRP
jgi:Ser/Thr protein kinase RdoA (MazF antagonist)